MLRSIDRRARGGEPALPCSTIVRFWQALGYPAHAAAGSWWVRHGRFRFYGLPWERELAASRAEVADALRRWGGLVAEYATTGEGDDQRRMFLLRPAGYDLGALSRDRRREVRRALEVTTIRHLTPDELLAQGPGPSLDTLARHGRSDPEFSTLPGWRRYVEAVRSTPGVSAVGAFAEGRLTAWMVICRDGATLRLVHKMSSRAALAHDASAAIDYWTIAEAAKDPSIELVDSGVYRRSLEFYKTSIGFELVPYRIAIVWHPAAEAVLATRAAAAALRVASRLSPGSRRIAGVSATARRLARRPPDADRSP